MEQIVEEYGVSIIMILVGGVVLTALSLFLQGV